MVGLYETAVDELCGWSLDGVEIRPKVIASTATIRRARDQVHGVFMRQVEVFPPRGLDIEDNFFSHQLPISAENPGRRYFGICAPGRSRPAVLIHSGRSVDDLIARQLLLLTRRDTHGQAEYE